MLKAKCSDIQVVYDNMKQKQQQKKSEKVFRRNVFAIISQA